jgi:hypothetical protein
MGQEQLDTYLAVCCAFQTGQSKSEFWTARTAGGGEVRNVRFLDTRSGYSKFISPFLCLPEG